MVLQGGPCGRVDRRRTQFNNEPYLLTQVGSFLFNDISVKSEYKQMIFGTLYP